jgi:glycosyltransferase involved in cell wall biosynthesis
MAKHNRLYVITRANNQDLIETYLPKNLKGHIAFYYYDAPDIIRNRKKKAKGLYFYYFCWQVGIIPIVKRILKTEKIDYTMHLTFGSMWMPTFLPFFKTPFIWGPVGGGDCEPKSFLKVLPTKQRIIQSARYIMGAISILNPFILIPSARAKVILTRTPNSALVIPKIFRGKTKVILETAMEDTVFKLKRKERNDGEIRLITTGRLLPNKNILTAVRALKYISMSRKVHLTIVGSGYQKDEILKEIEANGWKENVSIYDELPRQKVLEMVELSDIFLFPSLREGGSWSLMEAMAIGLPIVCLNWAGMAVTTDDLCAIRLPVTNPEQMPKDMAEAIMKLIKNPQLREQMGNAGRKRIRQVFNWESKGFFMENVLASLSSK